MEHFELWSPGQGRLLHNREYDEASCLGPMLEEHSFWKGGLRKWTE